MTETPELKVCMVMFYDENIKEYSEISCKINKFYCDKHAIDLIYSNKNLINHTISSSEKPSKYWEKYSLILEHIENYDYVIYIDTDAFFYINTKNIINEILLKNSKDFIFSQDWLIEHLNSGFFIVKKTKYSVDFLRNMLKKEVNDKYIMNAGFDQAVLSGLYRDNFMDIQNQSSKFNYGFLQYFFNKENMQYYDKNEAVYPPQPFVCHLAGTNKETRTKILSTYYNKIVNGEIYNV